MKVLLHTVQLASGGVEKLIEQRLEVSKNEPIEYVYTVNEPGGKLYEQLIKEKKQVYILEPSSKTGIFKYFRSFYDIVKKEKVQVVHIPASPSSSILLMAAWLAGCKKRIIHSYTNKYARSNGIEYENMKLKLFRMLNILFSNRRYADSKQGGEYCFGKHVKYKVLINGIDIDRFTFKKELRDRKRKELEIEDDFVIGHVGRFNIQKNHAFLIDVFYEIQKKIPNSKLLLLGKGEEEENMKQQIAKLGIGDKVKFLGEFADLAPFYFAMDVFVFPSFFEGNSIAAVEAQCTGLKAYFSQVIASDTIYSDTAVKLDLDKGAEEWANYIVDGNNARNAMSHIQAKDKGYFYIDTANVIIKEYLGGE